MNFDTPYLTRQIIAYIGNKRKLLSLIYDALTVSGVDIKPGLTFADLFSGSGVVSRFAKFLGFEVYANDWEPYAEVLLKGFVECNKRDMACLFGSEEAFADLLKKINALAEPAAEEQYIARYYAAHTSDIEKADFHTERLFYTKENGLAIDKIRNFIEKEYPESGDERRNLLLSLLLYEAATHTNTSGVFKAFHKGFGGHGKDALSRILAPIELHEPVLVDSDYPVHVSRCNANELAKKLPPLDVVYLDPPYNQHQYGSNYHLLNTIAVWDKIPEPLELDESGTLVNKAAIRADWTNTRSDYCYKKTATAAFEDLIASIRAHLILISYSSDGIIPFEEMKRICLSKGYVSIVTSGYTKYRGGKQSNSRLNSDIEFILVIDTTRKAKAECSERIDKVVLEKKFLLLLKRRFCKERLEEIGRLTNDSLSINREGEEGSGATGSSDSSATDISLSTADAFSLSYEGDPETIPFAVLEAVCEKLEYAACQTKVEELRELIRLTTVRSDKTALKYLKQIPGTLKKLAQKKYRAEYDEMLGDVEKLTTVRSDIYPVIADKIEAVKAVAQVRFSN